VPGKSLAASTAICKCVSTASTYGRHDNIMNVERYSASDLKPLFKRRGILVMSELKKALGTQVAMTVFRKLKELSYRTSYSHGGRYYTLEEGVRFDERGLWNRRGVWFSQHGTLMATLEAFASEAEAGYFADELREQLHVEVKESLLRLVQKERIHREMVGGRYLYCATELATRRRQLRKRGTETFIQSRDVDGEARLERRQVSDEVKAALLLFISLLDERQRRLYAGLEALKFGSGGDRQIAALLGLHPKTVAKGRHELLEQDVEAQRVRRPGGGRKSVEKKHRKSSRRFGS